MSLFIFGDDRFLIFIQQHPHYRLLLKALVKSACAPLEPEDLNEIDTAIRVQYNEKLKQRKSGKKKISAPTKRTLNVDKDDILFDEEDDDYDFM
jgi:hypothetical protein